MERTTGPKKISYLSRRNSINPRQRRAYTEFLYVLPFLILVLLFSYLPLYGWINAFHDFRPPQEASAENYVGIRWFSWLVEKPSYLNNLLRVLRNTFAMSGISLLFSWFPMVFAVFLNEIQSKKFRSFVQTVTTLPNFISWVLVYSVAFSLFSTNGAVNTVLEDVLHITDKPISFLQQSGVYGWFRMWLWLTWKNAGWAAIMYLAAISGIDDEMIEAAKVDGATRMQIIWRITIPSLLPTYFVIVMLNLANFLSNGMEQYLVFTEKNKLVLDYLEVLDLYVYNLTLDLNYPMATVMSIFKSVVSVALLFITNITSKLIRGEGFI